MTASAGDGIRGRDVVFGDLQSLVDAYDEAPYLSVILEAGPELRVLAVNRAARAALGDRPLLGRPAAEVMVDLERQGLLDPYRRAAATGEAQSAVEWQAHFQNPDGTGSVRWVDFTVTPCTVGGRVVAAVGRAWDVTDRVLDRQPAGAGQRGVGVARPAVREVVDTLQRALLPDRVPVPPGLDIAAAYLLAADERAAGGDWFDAVQQDGRVVLVVGDVVGHGVAASAAMGRLRAVLLDHLDAGEPITGVLAAVDRWARRHETAFGSTACLVELDPATGAFTYVTAGHPPPLLAAGADSRFLEPSGHGPLGELGPGAAYSGSLAVGEMLVLYSDGLVKLPGTTPMEGTVNLARTVQDAVANRLLPIGAPALATERVARHPIEHLVRLRGHTDDVTVLAAQRRDPPPQLAVDAGSADAAVVARCRAELLRWLAPLDVRVGDLDALLHVTGELVQNVVDHAYPDGTAGRVRLRATLEPDGATVVVADDGTWADPGDGDGRGLGLAMVRALADSLEIEKDEAGTTATVRHRLFRDAGLVPPVTVPTTAQPRPAADVWSDLGSKGPRVGARGPIDAAAAVQLAAALAISIGPDGDPATLDLRDVTLLGSAGVHTSLRARAVAPDLQIIAPAGSVAQHVLTLAAVPFVAG